MPLHLQQTRLFLRIQADRIEMLQVEDQLKLFVHWLMLVLGEANSRIEVL